MRWRQGRCAPRALARPNRDGQKGPLMAERPSHADSLAREITAVAHARSGDTAAHDQIIEWFVPLVVAKVRQYQHHGTQPTVLTQAGLAALEAAIADFPLDQVPRLRPHVELAITRALINATHPPTSSPPG